MTAPTTRPVPAFLEARRSIRSFRPEPVAGELLDALVEAACLAPAPHYSRPWRWVVVESAGAKRALADDMGARWRADLDRDGVSAERIDELVTSSRERLSAAPAALLGCLTWDGLDRYPDDARRQAEWGMALLSLGAGVENLMLAATAVGLASCWVAAPIFCPEAARDALDLPNAWLPHALVLVGRPDAAYTPRPRPPVDVDSLRVQR
jgi:coenzyme F420-0:L-glutamate ligase / coenzyme F420-1:gamma-L-glutamate ligase